MKKYLILLLTVFCHCGIWGQNPFIAAWYMGTYQSNPDDNWALQVYNEDGTTQNLQFYLAVPQSDRLSGKYTADYTAEQRGIGGTCYAITLNPDSTEIIYSLGELEVSYLRTEDGKPVYSFKGCLVSADNDSLKVSTEYVCKYAYDWHIYYNIYYNFGDAGMQMFGYDTYERTLVDDPSVKNPYLPKGATGEKKSLSAISTEWIDKITDYKYWQLIAYTSKNKLFLLSLSPKSTSCISGIYNVEDLDKGSSFYGIRDYFGGCRKIYFQSGSVNVTEDADSVYAEGVLLGYDGIEYSISMSAAKSDSGIRENTDPGTSESGKPRKVIRNHCIIIEREGRAFSLDGRMVKKP